MAITSFNRLAITWSLLSLATNVSGVAAKGRGGGGGSSGTCYDDQGYVTSCSQTNVGVIVGVVVGCIALFVICAFITHKSKQKKVQKAVKANPPKAWSPATNTNANANKNTNTAVGWTPSTGAAAIVTGTPAEKAATTPYNIGTGATGRQNDLQAYAVGDGVVALTSRPTSGTGNDTEIVAIMVYPANTYSPPNTYTPYASNNPYAVYAPPTGPPTGYTTSSPPAPPFKQPPSY